MDREEGSSYKKVYAKGFYDGLSACGVDTKDLKLDGFGAMNKAKFDSIMANATSLSKKVYDAVPITEPWSKTKIHNEVVRQGYRNANLKITEGCLSSLKSQGLVKEVGSGEFIRTKVVQKTAKAKLTTVPAANKNEEALSDQPGTDDLNPLELLYKLAERLDSLGDQIKCLSEDFKNTVLLIDEQSEETKKEFQKLKQLKSLLTDLGNDE